MASIFIYDELQFNIDIHSDNSIPCRDDILRVKVAMAMMKVQREGAWHGATPPILPERSHYNHSRGP